MDLYRSFNVPLSHNLLFEWRSMLTNGRRVLNDIGRYRTHTDPIDSNEPIIELALLHAKNVGPHHQIITKSPEVSPGIPVSLTKATAAPAPLPSAS